jgi:hypothetical protein
MGIPVKRAERLTSLGDATIGVSRDAVLDDRMGAALRFTDAAGQHYVVDLTPRDVNCLMQDLIVLLGANQAQVDAWWRRLADGRDGRPRAAVR